jgi:alkylation response protein AidB-like acyl-CoA dehydrogenase
MTASTPQVGSLALDLEPADPAAACQAWAREFAQEVVVPVGQVLDRMDSQQAVAPASPVFDFLAQAHREGFTRLTDSPERGGRGLSRTAEYVVLEELAAADAGLAAVLIAAPLPFRWAAAAGLDEVAAPFFSAEGGWSGCCAADRPGSRVRAARHGAGWLLTGSTSAWVTGAATATHALLACALEDDRRALAVVALDRPGVRRGPALDLLGLRAQGRARIVLDGVWVAAHELAPVDATIVDGVRALAHSSAAVVAVGIARAAYDGTVRLAHEDVFDGRVLVEHDDVRRRLMRMLILLEAARSMACAVHAETGERVDAGEPASLQHAAAAQAFATEAAFEIVDCAMVLCGGRADACGGVEYLDGTTFHPQKLLRDAQSYKVARPAGARPAPLAAAHH